MPKGRLIALLTDFGCRDAYVGAMKGVIHTLAGGVPVVDISHDVPRHNTASAAYFLHCVMPYYPRGTIFVCVVDPGVGTRRRILCLERGGHAILAPDNGIIEYLVDGSPGDRLYTLTHVPRTKPVSRTFHGRDIFSPAAAVMATGAKTSSLGKRIPCPDPRPLFIAPPGRVRESLRAGVLHIDNFGNIITNIRLPVRGVSRFSVSIGGKRITLFSDTYGNAPPRAAFYTRGSSGLLEISVREGDASGILGVHTGDELTIRRTE